MGNEYTANELLKTTANAMTEEQKRIADVLGKNSTQIEIKHTPFTDQAWNERQLNVDQGNAKKSTVINPEGADKHSRYMGTDLHQNHRYVDGSIVNKWDQPNIKNVASNVKNITDNLPNGGSIYMRAGVGLTGGVISGAAVAIEGGSAADIAKAGLSEIDPTAKYREALNSGDTHTVTEMALKDGATLGAGALGGVAAVAGTALVARGLAITSPVWATGPAVVAVGGAAAWGAGKGIDYLVENTNIVKNTHNIVMATMDTVGDISAAISLEAADIGELGNQVKEQVADTFEDLKQEYGDGGIEGIKNVFAKSAAGISEKIGLTSLFNKIAPDEMHAQANNTLDITPS